MTEPPGADGAQGFWLIATLFLAGAVSSGAAPLIARLTGSRVERARTWAMRAALALCTAGAAATTAAAVRHLTSCGAGAAEACTSRMLVWRLPAPVAGVPPLDLTIQVDGLSALFLALVGLCAACIALYSFGWLRGDPLRHSVAGAFNLFVAATLLTLVVSNVFWLFIGLELITLLSAYLVRYRGRSGGPPSDTTTAVRVYLMVSHAGLIGLLAGLLPVMVTPGKGLTFDALRAPVPVPAPGLCFVLVFLGLAVRAGVTPFHFWVPVVHPQLPTNTHAMMSAVMLKVAVYLMIRLFFEGMIGPVAWWWGVVVLTLAGVTAVVTVFYAMLSKDLKRALAYHSVENVGIILAGVGLALLFGDPRLGGPTGLRGVAGLALLASLYHVVNHALFKTLLFLGTGAIEKRTGTVETRRLGGLLRRAPWIGVTFLIGAVAIAGFPPLNGFISEWLTLQALLGGQAVYGTGVRTGLVAMTAILVALILLAMSLAMTALAFVKITGETLLGEPRSTLDARADSPWSMRSVMALLAGLCVLLGLQPWVLVPWLSAAIAPAGYEVGSVLRATRSSLSLTIHMTGGTVYQAVLPVWPLVLLAVLPVALLLLVRARGMARRPVWAGGDRFEPDTMQYTGTAVSALVWEPAEHLPGTARERPLPASFRLAERHVVVEQANRLFNGLVAFTLRASQVVGERLQNGDIRSYLLYIFSAFILVLALLVVSR